MNFSFLTRGRTSSADIAAAKAAAEAKRSAGLVEERRKVARSEGAAQAATPSEPVLTDVKSVPLGSYLSFEKHKIPSDFAVSFTVLTMDETSATVLVAPDSHRTHPQFDLARRLKEIGYVDLTTTVASPEIIRAVHSKHADDTRRSGGPDSEIEVAAWRLIDRGVAEGASDIHLETRGAYTRVFFRIFGKRVEQPAMATDTARAMCNVLYGVHADSNNKGVGWNPEIVDNTSIEHTTESNVHVQLRFSSAPIHPSTNFHAVIRLLVMDASSSKPLEEVGYTPEMVEEIEAMLVGAKGMVLLVGPTNSGKSTSMQSFVRRIYDRRGRTIKVLTVEDPVEYIMDGACQMGVPSGRRNLEDKKSGSTFTTFLKGMLRQDPDVGVIGEIRDAESAECVQNFVLAGRKLITTLHAYESFAVFARLREIGVPPSVLFMQGFISGVIYQRLVPVLCPDCSIRIEDAFAAGKIHPATYNRVLRVADLAQHNVRACGCGCETCRGTGIVGRTLCAEILVPDLTMLTMLTNGDELGARQYWQQNSRLVIPGLGASAVAHAITKMRLGLLDPSDIEEQLDPLVMDAPIGGAAHAYDHGDTASITPLRARGRSLPPSLR